MSAPATVPDSFAPAGTDEDRFTLTLDSPTTLTVPPTVSVRDGGIDTATHDHVCIWADFSSSTTYFGILTAGLYLDTTGPVVTLAQDTVSDPDASTPANQAIADAIGTRLTLDGAARLAEQLLTGFRRELSRLTGATAGTAGIRRTDLTDAIALLQLVADGAPSTVARTALAGWDAGYDGNMADLVACARAAIGA